MTPILNDDLWKSLSRSAENWSSHYRLFKNERFTFLLGKYSTSRLILALFSTGASILVSAIGSAGDRPFSVMLGVVALGFAYGFFRRKLIWVSPAELAIVPLFGRKPWGKARLFAFDKIQQMSYRSMSSGRRGETCTILLQYEGDGFDLSVEGPEEAKKILMAIRDRADARFRERISIPD